MTSSLRDHSSHLVGTVIIAHDIRHQKLLENQMRSVQLIFDTTAVVMEAHDIKSALQNCLTEICKALNWPIGHIYLPRKQDNKIVLFPSDHWYLAYPEKDHDFYAATMATTIENGSLFPGQVWAIGKPIWIKDLHQEPNFLYANKSSHMNIHGAFGFPIFVNGDIFAVFNFFSYHPITAGDEVLLTFSVLSEQISVLFEKQQTQAALAKKSQEIELINQQLTQSNRDLEQFAYITSHDLKSPLRAIENLVTWIEEDTQGKLSAESKKYMNLLCNRTQRLSNLIDGILEYSRAGRIGVEVSRVDTHQLINEIWENLGAPSTFELAYLSPLPVFETTRVPLSQVFSNLINNSIIHHHRKAGKIEVGANDKGPIYEFFVKDNGPGIEADYHEKIFMIFQTLQSRDTLESTGIGLSIVKKIVESQGGQIWVDSEAGKGATFYFTWPKHIRKGAANADSARG